MPLPSFWGLRHPIVSISTWPSPCVSSLLLRTPVRLRAPLLQYDLISIYILITSTVTCPSTGGRNGMYLFGGTQDNPQHCPSFIPCPPCPCRFHIRSSQVHLADPSTLSLPLPLVLNPSLLPTSLSTQNSQLVPDFHSYCTATLLLHQLPISLKKNEGNQKRAGLRSLPPPSPPALHPCSLLLLC